MTYMSREQIMEYEALSLDDVPMTNRVSHHEIRYCERVFEEDLTPIINEVYKSLYHYRYDTFVGTGLSGALLVPVLGRALKKNWMIVRRKGETSHSPIPVAGTMGDKWVFVDDGIASGRTFDYVYETIYDFFENNAYEVKAEYLVSYYYGVGTENFPREKRVEYNQYPCSPVGPYPRIEW